MYRFSKRERLLKRSDFTRLSAQSHRVHSRFFIIVWSPNDSGHTRIGITASRKVGCAVVRNRIKRLVREFYRLHKELFLAADYNLIAKKGVDSLDFAAVSRDLNRVLGRPPSIQC